jgi:hypothetical protein
MFVDGISKGENLPNALVHVKNMFMIMNADCLLMATTERTEDSVPIQQQYPYPFNSNAHFA